MELVLDATTASIRRGRQWVLGQASAHRVPREAWPVLALLTSEVLSNAVRHGSRGAGEVRVRFDALEAAVQVSVADGSAELPVERDPEPHEGGGRGVAIVRTLAQDWGVAPRPDGGKCVWFRLAVGATPSASGATREQHGRRGTAFR